MLSKISRYKSLSRKEYIENLSLSLFYFWVSSNEFIPSIQFEILISRSQLAPPTFDCDYEQALKSPIKNIKLPSFSFYFL